MGFFFSFSTYQITNHIKVKCKSKKQCKTNPSHPLQHPSSSHSSTSDVNRLIEAVQSHNAHLVRDRPSNSCKHYNDLFCNITPQTRF